MIVRDPKKKKLLAWRRDHTPARRLYDKADGWLIPLHQKRDDEKELPPRNFHLPVAERHERKKARRMKNELRRSFYVKGPWRFERFTERTKSTNEQLDYWMQSQKRNRKALKTSARRAETRRVWWDAYESRMMEKFRAKKEG